MAAADDVAPYSVSPAASAPADGLIARPAGSAEPRLAHHLRTTAWLDGFLVAGTLALAFLLASSPARNSDVWMHLASGRLMAEGKYSFTADPFNPFAEGDSWVNHAWLYDLVTYSFYRMVGGPGLIVIKSLLATALAAVLLLVSRQGRGLWVPALCSALAILAVSTRLFLQPVGVSYLFLALTLWFLERPRRLAEASDEPVRFRSYWPLLVLFVLWVNLDGWFLLGPLTVGLYALGQTLSVAAFARMRAGAPHSGECGYRRRRGQAPVLGLVLLAGLAVCLINPYHIHAFRLPAQLELPFAAASRADALRWSALTPFQSDYFHTSIGLTAAGLAYFPLVLLGVVSFALNQRHWSWPRALIWLTFFLLSASQARTIPFFAIVAGPIAALNLMENAELRMGNSRQPVFHSPFSILNSAFSIRNCRFATAVLFVGLTAAAWTGWLQTQPYEPRRWALESDPSLQEAATQIARWRNEGRLGKDTLGFTFSPEAAHYFAWFCLEEGDPVDARLPVFFPATDELRAVRRALCVDPGNPSEDDAARNRTDSRSLEARKESLRERHIRYVVLHESQHQRVDVSLGRLLADSDEWPLLYLNGFTTVFGWHGGVEAGESDSFAALCMDFEQLAYNPPEDKKAPPQWPGREPRVHEWWEAFVAPSLPHSDDQDEAAIHLAHFRAQRDDYQRRSQREWEDALVAGIAGRAGFGEAWPVAELELGLRIRLAGAGPRRAPADAKEQTAPVDPIAFYLRQNYLNERDDGPPALLLLAVRAARRSLRTNPDDPNAYLLLGEAYLRLTHNTRERSWMAVLPMLTQIRRVQAAATFNQALLLKPDIEAAHYSLAALYQEMGFVDLMLHHMKEFHRLTREAGRKPGETSAAFTERIARLGEDVGKLEKRVNDLQDEFLVNSAKFKVLDQAQLAAGKGLYGKALDLLLASDVAVFGTQGALLELHLLLATGRVREAREFMPREQGQTQELGAFSYHWFQAQIAAATGDYERLNAEIGDMIPTADSSADQALSGLSSRGKVAFAVTKQILDGLRRDASWLSWLALRREQAEFQVLMRSFVATLRQESDLLVLRALLALEAGETVRAESYFRQALDTWKSAAHEASGAGLDFRARPIAQHYLKLLTASKK